MTGRRPLGPFPRLSDAQRQKSLRATLANAPEPDALWVFAYGSLLWRPGFQPVESRHATLSGFRRGFNVWTVMARGTPRRPGLGLGLENDKQSACDGLALRVAAAERDRVLAALWAREMLTGIYQPQWLTLRSAERTLPAIGFVVDPAHRQYAGQLSVDEQAAAIRVAVGVLGSCRDYLAKTVAALAEHGVADRELETLLSLVDSG